MLIVFGYIAVIAFITYIVADISFIVLTAVDNIVDNIENQNIAGTVFTLICVIYGAGLLWLINLCTWLL